MNSKKKFLIFIPAFNVEKKIYQTFNKIPKNLFKNKHLSILVINDCSHDQTKNELIKIRKIFNFKIIHNKKNQGYGGVQKKAFIYAIKKNFD
jgi:glycosyltransferase involved in cell wall biosynthesis